MRRMFSTNRVDWFDQGVSISLENNAHNMGIIAKRADGILNPGEGYIVIYGGPEDAIDNNPQYGLISGATGNKWGYWDILGKAVDYTNLGSYSIPSGWQWGGMGLHSRTISGGDYDGDGLTDRAIYDVNTGAWFVIPSKTNTAGMIGIPWNNTLGIPYQPGFEILVGDFDGDGKTDPGMVDVVNGRWYILGSKNGYSQGIPNNANGVLGGIPWGWQWAGAGANNKPVSGADYDGDGRADRATVNVATGAWYVIPSNTATAGFAGIPWGSNLSVPYQAGFHVLVGDFDGDGKTDPGILNAANGRWYIRRSGDGYQGGIGPFTWGWQWLGTNSNHRPVIADYDGDGKADVAVMEKNAGLWFVHSSHKSLYLNSVQHYDTIPWAQAVVPGYNLADWEPVLGNFDGRTRADVSVVNRNGGYWYIRGSRNPYTVGITLTTFDLP